MSLHQRKLPKKILLTLTSSGRTSVEREKHDVVHRKRCRHRESAADYGCRHGKSLKVETAMSAVCCRYGFLKDDNQQKENDCQKKLVVKDKKFLSYEVRVLSSEDTLYGTWFMFRLENGTDHELSLIHI